MMRRTFILFAALCTSIFLSNALVCAEINLDFLNPFKGEAEPEYHVNDTRQLISNELLSKAGMKSDWQINLPIQVGEKVGKMYIKDNLLYVFTDNNFLFAIERNKGTLRFGLRLSAPGLPVLSPTFYEDKMYLTIGNKLIVVDPYLGNAVFSQQLGQIGNTAVCPYERNSELLYAVSSNGRLQGLEMEHYFVQFMVTPYNDSPINSMLVDEGSVIFAAESGNIVNIPATQKSPVWQTDIAAGIAAPIVRDGDSIYVSSLDMKVYRLSARSGYTEWKTPFQTGQPLRASVRVGKDVVYQYAEDDGIYAISKATGKKVWNLPDGFDLLAEKGNRSYLIGQPAKLYVMDNVKKELVYSINAAGVSSYAVNNDDANIYLADATGRVLAVEVENAKFEVQ